MTRCINEVKLIGLAIFCLIIKANSLGFNGDAALFLDIHIIEDLFFHLAVR